MRKTRILIVQLARLGDTLQSLMALRAAKQLYPELEIHLVVRERFADAAKRVDWLAGVHVLPTEALIGPILKNMKTETETLPEIAKWVAPLVEKPWDLLFNWTYSEASSFLSGLIPSRVKLGFTRRKDLTLTTADGWSHYVQAIVQGQVPQNIHLTDILTTQLLTALQIHVGEPTSDSNLPVTSKNFFARATDEHLAELGWAWRDLSKRWIAIQLGSSTASKSWPAASWAKLANYVLKRHPDYNLIILGGKADRDLEAEFYTHLDRTYAESRRVISMVGETTFDLWSSIVARAQWLLSADTAAIHLASVLGTPVLNVSVGPVKWCETGPYGNGHYVVSSNIPCPVCDGISDGEHRCRTDLSPETVYAVWSYAINEWSHRRQLPVETHFAQLGWTPLLQQARVFRARIRPTSDGGGIAYEPLIQKPLLPHEWSSLVMGHVARAWYCGWLPPLGAELSREKIGPELLRSLRGLDESIDVLIKIITEIQSTVAVLVHRTHKGRQSKLMTVQEKTELGEIGRKLAELDRLFERVCNTQPLLKGFTLITQVLMHNLKSSELGDLGRESASCYRQVAEGIHLLKDWVRHSLQLARPIAIVNPEVECKP